jgi:hypothetical protein
MEGFKMTVQEKIAKGMDDYLDEEITTEYGFIYTRQELNDAFSMVTNPDDWKAPINKVIPGYPVTKTKVAAAIMFYTATVATFTDLDDGRCRVESAGYRNGPAGDH